MIFVGKNLEAKVAQQLFRASLGKFGQKSSHPQKFACSHTYGRGRRPVRLPPLHVPARQFRIVIQKRDEFKSRKSSAANYG